MLVSALIVASLLSFLLSGMESEVLSVSRVRVRHAAEEDEDKPTSDQFAEAHAGNDAWKPRQKLVRWKQRLP